MARAQSHAADTRALLVPTLAAGPFALTLLWLASDLALVQRRPLLGALLALGYLALLAVRVLGAAYGPVRARPVIVALACLLLTPWVLGFLNLDTRLWVAEEPEQTDEQEAEDPGQAEALLYDQPARIAAAVAHVKPAQGGRPGVYFVGFAGDGDQEIFRREALFASQAFGERYGSRERSVLLVNDVEDRDSYPLASVSGLSQTLRGLAAGMDAEQDVLVLFLTSHGSEDGLEVDNGGLPLGTLAPVDLRQALDESGIRWRLLVVSACYAGVFVEELKGDTTAIVTASDASHSSFGCEDDRELTWFGEAFLKDSLPGSASIEAAFNKAAALIARRESAEHQVHSNPQLFVGALMAKKLEALEAGRPLADPHAFSVRR